MFPYDTPFTNNNKVDLDTYPAVPAVNKYLGSELNVLITGANALATAITAGQYHGLTSNPAAPLSGAGEVRLRGNAGVLEVSGDGGAYSALVATLITDTPQIITSSGGHIAISMANGQNFYHSPTQVTVLDAPTNALAGMSGVVEFVAGAQAYAVTFNSFWKFSGGVVPTLTAIVGARDLFIYYVNQGATSATCRMIGNVL